MVTPRTVSAFLALPSGTDRPVSAAERREGSAILLLSPLAPTARCVRMFCIIAIYCCVAGWGKLRLCSEPAETQPGPGRFGARRRSLGIPHDAAAAQAIAFPIRLLHAAAAREGPCGLLTLSARPPLRSLRDEARGAQRGQEEHRGLLLPGTWSAAAWPGWRYADVVEPFF
jgi:hypothetical protein